MDIYSVDDGPRRTVVWSYGGGVQSAAIGVLVASGRLPKPDIAVIADTGRESSSTWDYLGRVMNPYLQENGCPPVEIAAHELSTVDLYSGAKAESLVVPMFLGNGGKLPTHCSVEWKRRVVRRWLRAKGVERAELWLGISTDEVERAKPSDVEWLKHEHPLLRFDIRYNRARCLDAVRAAGLAVPEKSACWMCPFRSDGEWLRMRDLYPADFASAVKFDKEHRDAPNANGSGAFVHRSMKPLSDVNLDAKSSQGRLDLCDSGHCWT